MKKNTSIVIVIVVVLIVAVGGFALFHKSSKSPASTNTSTSTSSNNPPVNNAVLSTKTAAGIGQYLATPSGMPLYTYGSDTSGVSKCTGTCLSTWPAYQDTGSTTGLPTGVGTITRPDNSQTQFTYNGMPLYTFVSDSVGHVTGNGVAGFKVAAPAAAATTAPSTSSSSSSSSSSSNYSY